MSLVKIGAVKDSHCLRALSEFISVLSIATDRFGSKSVNKIPKQCCWVLARFVKSVQGRQHWPYGC